MGENDVTLEDFVVEQNVLVTVTVAFGEQLVDAEQLEHPDEVDAQEVSVET